MSEQIETIALRSKSYGNIITEEYCGETPRSWLVKPIGVRAAVEKLPKSQWERLSREDHAWIAMRWRIMDRVKDELTRLNAEQLRQIAAIVGFSGEESE